MSEPAIPLDIKSQDQRSVIFTAACDLHTAVCAIDRELALFPYELVRDGIIPQAQAEKEQMLLAVARRILDVRRRAAWFHWLWAITGKLPEQEPILDAPSSPVGMQGPQGTDGPLREPHRPDEGGSNTLHNEGAGTTPQPLGGQSVP